MYAMEEGALKFVKKASFFDVVKSVNVIGNRVLVVFNGYLVVLDEMLNDEYTSSVKGSKYLSSETENNNTSLDVGKYRFGRSCIDYKNVGCYVAHTDQTLCLASFFGQMLFYTINNRLFDPIEYSANCVILDFKAMIGSRIYMSLEKRNRSVVLRTYEHINGAIIVRSEVSVPGGYLIMPFENSGCVVIFSTNGVFLVRDFSSAEMYKVVEYGVNRVVKSENCIGDGFHLFTCFSSCTTQEYSLSLVMNEIGEVFKIDTEAELKMSYVTRIPPCRDIDLHPDGFLISIGYNADNCVYHLKRIEDRITLELTDVLDVLTISRSAGMFYDGLYHIYLSDTNCIKEVVRTDSLTLVSSLDLAEEAGSLSRIFTSKKVLCAILDENVHVARLSGDELVHMYAFEAKDEIVGYFRCENVDFYLMDNVVETIEICNESDTRLKGSDKQKFGMVIDAGNSFSLIRRHKLNYDLFSTSECYLFLVYGNKITIMSSKTTEVIELDFNIKGLASTDRYLFVLTGKRVLRVYDLVDRRYVFIQSFRADVLFISLFDACLYTAGTKIQKFKINEDGSLSIPKQVKCNGMPVGFKEGLLLFKDTVIVMRNEEMLGIDGFLSVSVGTKIIVGNKNALNVYEHENNEKYTSELLADEGTYKIVCGEMVYIENINNSFRVKNFSGSVVIEGSGEALDLSSSGEHKILSIGVSVNDEEPRYFLRLYKNDMFVYDYEIDCKAGVVSINGKRIYCGSGDTLYGYEIGIKTLLRKSKVVLPSKITKICSSELDVFAGTEKDSVFVVRGNEVLFSEKVPRHITALERTSKDKLMAGDMAGNILVMEFSKDSLNLRACMFINDIPVQFVSGDRTFAICLSGKVCEITQIDDALFGFFEKVEWEVRNSLQKSFFEMFRREGFVDAEYLKMFHELNEKQTKHLSESAEVDIESMLDVINFL